MKNTLLHWTGILLSIISTLSLVGCSSSDPNAPENVGRDPALAAIAENDDLRAATFAYHGAGTVRASMDEGRRGSHLPYKVERQKGGNATVTITKPDQSLRVVRFTDGAASGVDGAAFTSSRYENLNIIKVGEEQYAIPDHVIYGN